ncbi:peptidoglycan-binding protein [Streptomyces yangpuensis]|uniref:peptidoglycan-binding domain-containing protein n=1 Tax=Streptomyces yangpuensis TaxID=1648182 RepID=UPI0038120299
MSQDPDEIGLAPDDALFVRPYVAPSGPPARAEAPAWPQTGPFAFPDPTDDPADDPADASAARAAGGRGHHPGAGAPAPVTGPAGTPAAAARRARHSAGSGAGRRSRLPLAVGTVLGLAAVGGLVLLLTGPDPQAPRAEPPADLTVPALPGGPAVGTESPGPTASARSAAPSASATEAPSRTASPAAKPSTAPSASAARPSSAYVTLRMGDSGPEVRALQELLQGQGFTYVSVTGVYDGQTKRGVGQLQRDRSIKGDPQGVYGPNTQAAMG